MCTFAYKSEQVLREVYNAAFVLISSSRYNDCYKNNNNFQIIRGVIDIEC